MSTASEESWADPEVSGTWEKALVDVLKVSAAHERQVRVAVLQAQVKGVSLKRAPGDIHSSTAAGANSSAEGEGKTSLRQSERKWIAEQTGKSDSKDNVATDQWLGSVVKELFGASETPAATKPASSSVTADAASTASPSAAAPDTTETPKVAAQISSLQAPSVLDAQPSMHRFRHFLLFLHLLSLVLSAGIRCGCAFVCVRVRL